MYKPEVVDKMAAITGTSKAQSEKSLNAFLQVVEDTLKKNDKVTLVGFGTFEVRNRKAKKGRNPQTKDALIIPAKKAPAFKVGKGFGDSIKNS